MKQRANPPAEFGDQIDLVQYFDSLAATRDLWIKKNWYYHQQLTRTLSFFIPADSSVLEIGSSHWCFAQLLEAGTRPRA